MPRAGQKPQRVPIAAKHLAVPGERVQQACQFPYCEDGEAKEEVERSLVLHDLEVMVLERMAPQSRIDGEALIAFPAPQVDRLRFRDV